MRTEIWQERAKALEKFNGRGLTASDVASITGLNPNTVRQYASKFGFDFGRTSRFSNGDKEFESRLSKVREYASAGKTRIEAATEIGVSYQTLTKLAKEYEIVFVHGLRDRGVDYSRNEAMAFMYRGGKTLQEIGTIFGISRERVRQVIKKRFGKTAVDGGQSAISQRRKDAADTKREAKCLKKYGCSRQQYLSLLNFGRALGDDGVGYYRTPVGAYTSQKHNAVNRGIEWNLSLWDWWNIWQQSGKWDQRGRGKTNYVMCRFGDTGSYERGNVYIATCEHNGSFQPNNPYRKGHPDHDKVVATLRKKSVRRAVPSKYGLPLGVTKQGSRFVAQISLNGRNKYIGSFDTPEEAHAAYLTVAAEAGLKVAA